MNKTFMIAIATLSSLMFSACTPRLEEIRMDQEQNTRPNVFEDDILHLSDDLSQSTQLEDLAREIDDTVIVEEDFSDL